MILVNATSCKIGGAKQIAEKFLNDFEQPEELIVLGPKSLSVPATAHRHIAIETAGITTMLFSTLFIAYFVLKYRVHTLFSFANINLILPLCQRVTYFHQLKILTTNNIRFRAFRFITRNFLVKSNRYVFQTSYVKSEFEAVFGHCKYEICWPGVSRPPAYCVAPNKVPNVAFIPYAYTSLPQKNFQLFAMNDWSQTALSQIVMPATDFEGELSEKFESTGLLTRSEMNNWYLQADILMVASIEETVCLPIFEFAATGKPVLVLNAQYIQGINNDKPLPKNIVLFESASFSEKLNEVITNYTHYCLQSQHDYKHWLKSQWPVLTVANNS